MSALQEIQQLMIEWEDEIQSSEKIFLRASTASKRSFWGYPGAVLEKGDERVSVFPFPTRRPVSQRVTYKSPQKTHCIIHRRPYRNCCVAGRN